MIKKPMLAATCKDFDKLKFPLLATPKIDGIRCLVLEGPALTVRAVSRNFKPIQNNYVRQWIEDNCPVGFDGELTVGKNFQETGSGIMSYDGKPDFTYRVFDFVWADVTEPYHKRIDRLVNTYGMGSTQQFRIELVLPKLITSLQELQDYEVLCLEEGYEGVMVRDPNGPYKEGRSTEREGFLSKIKRFQDSDALVVGYAERMHNANEATKDELGRTKRSSHKANRVPMGTLGALRVKEIHTGIEFEIGTGFDDMTRDKLWAERDRLVGRIVKYKSQPTGVKEAPRFPVFLGFRS